MARSGNLQIAHGHERLGLERFTGAVPLELHLHRIANALASIPLSFTNCIILMN
jgi:hypothetical protein